jgi:hypothetical protein
MGNIVNTSGGGNALAAYGGVNPWAEAARGVADGAYLKFNGNTGAITFGSDDEDLPEGSRLVVDMLSLSLGFICWMDSQVQQEVLVPVIEGKAPLEHELEDHGPYEEDDGWREAASLSAVILSYGQDDQDEAVGTKLLFKTSTGGQVRSIKKLSGSYGRLFMQHPGKLPIVELTTESYMPKVKKHGKKFSLIFKIVGWISEAEAEAMVAGDVDDERDYEPAPAAAPARGQRQAALPAPVEEEEEPAPAPRRRAAAAPVVEEEEEAPAPAPRRRAAAPAPVEEELEEEVAPAPRRRAAAPAPVEEELEEEVAPAPRRARGAAPADEDEGDVAPTPRGRSAGRGAPPASARIRRFD